MELISCNKNYDISFGLLGQGNSVQEAIDDFYNSLKEMAELYADQGKNFPENLGFEFKYDIPSFLEYYSDEISLAGLGRITGINRKQLSRYLTGHRQPSKKQ